MKQRAAIITSESAELGRGHLQRMLSLADYLNRYTAISASLIKLESKEDQGITSFKNRPIPPETTFIIRDMRDSTLNEMAELRRSAPVIAIDDAGSGRSLADLAVDLLPVISRVDPAPDYRPDAFLYGHNFLTGLDPEDDSPVDRDFDFCIYLALEQSEREEIARQICGKTMTAVLLGGQHPLLYRDGCLSRLDGLSQGKILLSSKTVISHFGIMLYEGLAAGCGLIALNPTQYHSSLCEASGLPASNLGVISDISINTLTYAAEKCIAELHPPKTEAGLYNQCLLSHSKFADIIVRFQQKRSEKVFD